MNRRHLLTRGAGLALAAAATGLAPRWLRYGIPEARAATPAQSVLLLAISDRGDPVNACAPGSYVPGTVHPEGHEFQPADVTFGSTKARAGALWQTVPEAFRDRLAVLHHRTHTVAHNEFGAVMALRGAVKGPAGNGQEMLGTAVAQELAVELGTLQSNPICLGDERLCVGGAPLPTIRPSQIKALFSASPSILHDLGTLRDAHLDALYADLRDHGTPAQRAFLDEHAASRGRARALGDELGILLEGVDPEAEGADGPADQIAAAIALAALRVTPVVTFHLPWGGDNHTDGGLVIEAEQSLAAMGHLAGLWRGLTDLGLEDAVTFAMLNVFGRKLQGSDGRQHHPDHSVMLLAGPRVSGGVVGGLGSDLRARGFDPTTGAARDDGGVDATQTLASAGATVMQAVGIGVDRRAARIPGGVPVTAVVT